MQQAPALTILRGVFSLDGKVIGAYDVSADGQRFLVVYEPGQPNAAISLAENWDAELKK